MSDFKVDLEAMSSFVESLSSFEEKAKEYDVEDWVPNSGMLEHPEVWDRTNAFQDTWEKGTNDLREEIKAASSAVSGALGAYSEYMEKAKEYMTTVQTAAEALSQSPVVGSGA
ncbi:hypothetical protein QP500_09985 [Pauljensenia sp. UMB0018B]|uniref:Proteins of 100 residues with WXG n=1 Tax=Schaalia odontolytica TaxID=1660 RepID=A0A2I1HXS2_9ACTO|nr:hypothetical protein [Schaalia odontolytica]MDK7340772.1 hypothetical protein [Pauljensenia sp. UMB0018B]PKY63665.1 hypothetical protein CYJ22_09885 [Schaalia odontolytica]